MKIAEGNVFGMIAVKDIDAAKKFYSETLGLNLLEENPGGLLYQSGSGKVFVYETPNAGTNKATSASWEVDDIVTAVKELQDKNISFEEYDMPGTTHEGAVHVMGEMKAAWFKDPDGNILGLNNAQ
jgi:catechol 2,3-dioxygenase-like lactoylglutathione lyase family enzyme